MSPGLRATARDTSTPAAADPASATSRPGARRRGPPSAGRANERASCQTILLAPPGHLVAADRQHDQFTGFSALTWSPPQFRGLAGTRAEQRALRLEYRGSLEVGTRRCSGPFVGPGWGYAQFGSADPDGSTRPSRRRVVEHGWHPGPLLRRRHPYCGRDLHQRGIRLRARA